MNKKKTHKLLSKSQMFPSHKKKNYKQVQRKTGCADEVMDVKLFL